MGGGCSGRFLGTLRTNLVKILRICGPHLEINPPKLPHSNENSASIFNTETISPSHRITYCHSLKYYNMYFERFKNTTHDRSENISLLHRIYWMVHSHLTALHEERPHNMGLLYKKEQTFSLLQRTNEKCCLSNSESLRSFLTKGLTSVWFLFSSTISIDSWWMTYCISKLHLWNDPDWEKGNTKSKIFPSATLSAASPKWIIKLSYKTLDTIYLFDKLRQSNNYNEKVIGVWKYLSQFSGRVVNSF